LTAKQQSLASLALRLLVFGPWPSPVHGPISDDLNDQRYGAEREAKRQFDRARAEHHSVDAQYWDIYYLRLLHELRIAEDTELRAALVAATRKGTNWRQVRPDTREVLARLTLSEIGFGTQLLQPRASAH